MDQDDLTSSVWDSVLRPAHGSVYEDMDDNPFKDDTDFGANQPHHTRVLRISDDPDQANDNTLVSEDMFALQLSASSQSPDNNFRVATGTATPIREVPHSLHEIFSHLTQEPASTQNGFSAGDVDLASTDALFSVSDGKFPTSSDLDDPLALSMPAPVAVRSSPRHKQRARKYTSNVVVHHLTGRSMTEIEAATDPLAPSSGLESQLDSLTLPHDADEAANLSQQADAPLYDIDKQPKSPQKRDAQPDTHMTAAKSCDPLPFSLAISVGNPVKIGDITSAHIEYSIQTTINRKAPDVNSGFLALELDQVVTRRYRDFRWLYNQLHVTHPGRIVPPPPAKQSYVGRFNEASIENRRLLLERMLARIAAHPLLADSEDFLIFLTSSDFATALRERESLVGQDSVRTVSDDPTDNTLHDSLDPSTSQPTSGPGNLLSSFFSISSKPHDPDVYFLEKRDYIDDFELKLRQFARALDLIGTQRHALLTTLEEMCVTCREIAALEVLRGSSDLYDAFALLQMNIRENLDRINMQEQMTLSITIEEYLRIIMLIRQVLDDRSKVYAQYNSFQIEFEKKLASLEKLTRKNKTQTDRVGLAKFEVDRLSVTVAAYEKQLLQISEIIREELASFELERVEDFRNNVEIFIESSIESQKEAIELYETFYEHQNLVAV